MSTKGNQNWKTIIIFVVLVVILGGASIAYSTLSAKYKTDDSKTSGIQSVYSQGITAASQEEKRVAALDFEVLDQNGNTIKLSSLYGKPLVLNFWASWCPPCKAEMPDFNKIYKEVKDKVTFVMVDTIDGQRETMAIGKAFIQKQGYEFPVYYDTKQNASSIYQIESIPTTLVIDANGLIVEAFTGMISETKLRNALAKAGLT